MRNVSPAFCLIKPSFLTIVVIISSCFKFSHQQQQSGFTFNHLNHFEMLSKDNKVSSQSALKHENWFHPGQELVFVTTTAKPREKRVVLKPGQELIFVTTTSKPLENSVVYINNKPTVATLAPFIPTATTSSPEFMHCLSKCPTTSEFNPVCATNRQVYSNEQKFNCARQCGAAIEIVRYGSCEGLFPVARG